MKEKYTFSVVIPIYNTGDYLRQTLDSVVNQTVGFFDNIQLKIGFALGEENE